MDPSSSMSACISLNGVRKERKAWVIVLYASQSHIVRDIFHQMIEQSPYRAACCCSEHVIVRKASAVLRRNARPIKSYIDL